MCLPRLSLVFCILFLALSSVAFSEDVSSTPTPKEKALQLLNDLDNLNSQQLQNSEDLQTQLDDSKLREVQLKTTLKEVVSSSTDLEKSLAFSQMLNNFGLPIAGAIIIGEAITIMVVKK